MEIARSSVQNLMMNISAIRRKWNGEGAGQQAIDIGDGPVQIASDSSGGAIQKMEFSREAVELIKNLQEHLGGGKSSHGADRGYQPLPDVAGQTKVPADSVCLFHRCLGELRGLLCDISA